MIEMYNQKKKEINKYTNFVYGAKGIPFIDGVLDLLKQHGEGKVLPKTDYEIFCKMQAEETILAMDKMKVVGHQTFYVWPDRLCIEPRGGVVHKDYRGAGLGTEMREQILSIISEKYPKHTIVAVASIDSQGIWKKLGFTDAQKGDILPTLLLDCSSCSMHDEAIAKGDSCCHKMLVYRKEK